MSSPKGKSHHHAENVESGKFVFTADETGDYMTCFVAPGYRPTAKFAVDFEWKSGVEAKDWTTIAKRGQITVKTTCYLTIVILLHILTHISPYV